MNLLQTPLEPSSLSPAAQRAIAPGPARMMAAKGLAPLPSPLDAISVLYQLACDADQAVAAAATQAATELPDRILAPALASPGVDPRVLDFFSGRALRAPAVMEAIVLNAAAAGATVAALAAKADGKAADLIANNEERLLANPAIIAALYTNPRARMSTVDRAVELAVRNGVKVAQIPSWDELCRALTGNLRDPNAGLSSVDADAMFEKAAEAVLEDAEAGGGEIMEAAEADAEAAAEPDPEETENLPISKMTVPMKLRLAALGNAFARSILVRDAIRLVAMAAIKSPGVTDGEAVKYAGNNSLSDDVIGYIANRKEWTKLYGVKLALIQNPKTSIPVAIRFMPHLREKDLRIIARSKGISSAVVAQARKLVTQRGKGGG